MADALDYAHKQGVIHRDIKPSNLMLGHDGRLSVLDFGLARMLEEPGMTISGEFLGTPRYMSPEQIAVGRSKVDGRTDIYSLGATLYELLTLTPAFAGDSRDQVIAQILQKDPLRPCQIDKRIPVDLETICLKALDKVPDRRYQTGSAFAADLRRYVNRFAITAKRAGPVERLIKWGRRHRAAAALACAVLLLGVATAFFAYTSYQARQATRAAEGERVLDQVLVEVLSGRYAEAEPLIEKAKNLGVAPVRIDVFRGLVAFESADPETAIRHLESALAQRPDTLAAQALLLHS